MGVLLHHTLLFITEKLPNLKRKTQPKQVLYYLSSAFALPIVMLYALLVLGLALLSLDNHKLTGWNLSSVFNSRHGRAFAPHTSFATEKLPNLKMKTRPKQFLSSLLLAFALPELPCLFLLLLVKQPISWYMYQSGTFVRTLEAHPFNKKIRRVHNLT